MSHEKLGKGVFVLVDKTAELAKLSGAFEASNRFREPRAACLVVIAFVPGVRVLTLRPVLALESPWRF